MATTNTLQPLRRQVPIDEPKTWNEFRAARESDDLTELYFAVDHEDKLRAVAAHKLELIYQAETLNSDIAQQRHDVLVDAEAELRTFMSNLASTLDAAAHRSAALDLEMREAGLTAGELLQFVDALASGDCLARTLLLRVAGPPT